MRWKFYRSKQLNGKPKKGNVYAKAQCDLTGKIVPYDSLVKQYEYGGDGLYWKGIYVYSGATDIPNPQLLKPKIYKDPRPLDHPRPVYYPTAGS